MINLRDCPNTAGSQGRVSTGTKMGHIYTVTVLFYLGIEPVIKSPPLKLAVCSFALFCVKSRAAFIVFTVVSCLMGFISLIADFLGIVIGVSLGIVILAVILIGVIIVEKYLNAPLVFPKAIQVTYQRNSENWLLFCLAHSLFYTLHCSIPPSGYRPRGTP